jgi:hypothetical protein
MASKVVISKKQFDEFWDEVLGSNWYIEEWNVDDDEYEHADSNYMLTITTLSLGWQSFREEPEPNGYMTAARIKSGSHLAALRSWLDRQEMIHVSAYIPKESLAEFYEFLKRVGGQAQ